MTSSGKPHPPSMQTYLKLIVEAWNGITKDSMIKSFKTYGLTNSIDDTEDNKINCFRPDGLVPTGRVLLQQAREEKELADILEEIDLKEDEENGIASDNSIEI